MKWIRNSYNLMRNVLEAAPVFCSLRSIMLKDAFLAALLLDHLKKKDLSYLLKYYEFEHPEKGMLMVVYMGDWAIFRAYEEDGGHQLTHYYEVQRRCECVIEYILTDSLDTPDSGNIVYKGHHCEGDHRSEITERLRQINKRMQTEDFLKQLKRNFQ